MAQWRVGTRWNLVAVCSPIALYLLAGLVMRVVSGTWPDWSRFGGSVEIARLGGVVGWAFHTLPFGFGEETGWRGFALPRLQRGRSARSATLQLWVLWAFWHLPMFGYNKDFLTMGPFDLVGWLVGILSGAIVFTWLHNSTRGSILMVALWHGTYNATVSATEPLIAAVVSGFVMLAAVIIARVAGPENLSRLGKHTI